MNRTPGRPRIFARRPAPDPLAAARRAYVLVIVLGLTILTNIVLNVMYVPLSEWFR